LGVAGAGQMENDLILDGGTLSFVGLTNCSLNNYPVLNPNGGTFNVASSTNILTLVKAAVGPGSLTKTGPGELIMTVASDNYAGGTFINAGTVSLTSASVGSGPLTLNNTVTLILTNNLTLTNTITIAGPATTIQTISTVPGTNIFTGPWTGGGTATFIVTNMYVFTGDLSGLSGTLEFGASTGGIQFNNATNKNFCTGSIAATFDLGTGTEQLNNLNGVPLKRLFHVA
jgi:autotransporter-associated beta strand protein